MAQEVVWGGIR